MWRGLLKGRGQGAWSDRRIVGGPVGGAVGGAGPGGSGPGRRAGPPGTGPGAGAGAFLGRRGPSRAGPWRARSGARCSRTACAAARPRRSGAGSAAGPLPPPPASCPHSWALWCPRCSPCSASSSSCASVSAAAPGAPPAPGRGPGPPESHQLCLVPAARPPSDPGASASGARATQSGTPVPSQCPLLSPVSAAVPVFPSSAYPSARSGALVSFPACSVPPRSGAPVLCVPT